MTSRSWFVKTSLFVMVVAFAWLPNAYAFTHVVQAGDTLANLAERYYGKVQNERLLVAANGLDVGSGIRIAPGMRLEVPALMTVRVEEGQTWKDLAIRYLGAEARAFAIAQANDSQPWLFPEVGSEIVIPLFTQSARTDGAYLLGVLDLDSPKLNRFDEEDRRGLEALAAILTGSLTI